MTEMRERVPGIREKTRRSVPMPRTQPIEQPTRELTRDARSGLDLPHGLNRLRHVFHVPLDYGVPVFTDDLVSSNYPAFKGPATL